MIGRIRLCGAVVAAVSTLPAQETVRFTVGMHRDGAVRVPNLHAAIDAARGRRDAERAARSAPVRIEIVLAAGIHELATTAVVDAGAGGVPDAPTVITGPGARLIGGRVVARHHLRSDVPPDLLDRLPSDEVRAAVRWLDAGRLGVDRLGAIVPRGMGRAPQVAPSELFWHGRPLTLARWPDAGFTSVAEIVEPGSVPRDREADIGADATGPDRGGTFRSADPRVERWQTTGAWMHGYWKWDWADELLPVDRIDPAERTITLALPHHYGLDAKARFAAVNVIEELDQPGEYYLDFGRNAIAVWPPDDATADAVLTTLGSPLIDLQDAEHVLIQDLELGPTRGVAIRVSGGASVAIEGCRVRGTGSHGVVLRGQRHRVARCTIEDTGASGVTLAGGDRATLTAGQHVVEDCEITRFARLERTYRPAVAISGVGHRVAHNHIHDAPHSAILVAGNEHTIESNEIHHVLLETGDCGAIYAGRDWAMHGTLIRHNLIRDLPGTEDRWQNAIYLDDMASGITVEGNVILRCNLGMLIGGGRNITVRHNVLVDCGEGLRFDARGTGWMASSIADPTRSTLHQRLAALPIDRPPWSVRYPEAQRTLTLAFGHPAGSAVLGNAFFRTPFGKVDDPDHVAVDGNRSSNDELDPTGSRWLDVRDISGFPAIPIAEIGPSPVR